MMSIVGDIRASLHWLMRSVCGVFANSTRRVHGLNDTMSFVIKYA
jgi:hypothetical protein